MLVSFKNKKDKVYYFKAVETKNGKFRYSSALDPKKANLEVIPNGFEIHEKPEDSLVVLRKALERKISKELQKEVEEIAINVSATKDIITDVYGNILTIYKGRIGKKEFMSHFPVKHKSYDELYYRSQTYTPVMRFVYEDIICIKKYIVERYCYSGRDEGWLYLAMADDLIYLAGKYCFHIGRESFFDL